MKKFLKGLRFVLCYLAITLATATGFVIYTTNTTGNVSNGNTMPNGGLSQIDNNLMEVVSNLMTLESFNLDSTISLADTKTQDQTTINIDFDINLGANLSAIEACGQLNILYKNENYNIDICFTDNTFFITALDKNLSFTTTGIGEGLMGVINLLDINLPIDSSMTENFDPMALLGYMGEYKEVETETGYDISLEFMGYNITMVCDKDFNLNSVQIPSVSVEGFDIDVKANLDLYEEKPVIEKPAKTFLNLDTITSLVPMAQDILTNNFVSADITASYQDYTFDFNAKADFKKDLTMLVTSPLLKGVTIGIKNNSLYATVGNLKLQENLNDLESILDFIKNDMKANLDSIDPTVVSTITNKTQELSNSITNELNAINLDKILDYIDYLQITDNQVILTIPNVCDIYIDITNNTITQITAIKDDINIVIDNISFEKEAILFDTNDFVKFDEVFPTFKKFINTLFTKGISGQVFINGLNTAVNYGIRYTTHFETSFDTTILNKQLALVTDNAKLYLSVDGVKVNIDLAEYQTILDYLKDTFGICIEIPQVNLPEISPKLIAGLSLNFIDYIKPIKDGIEISVENIIIQITCNENYLRNITVITNGDTISLDITGYGEVDLFEINKADYLAFEDITNYIDNATRFIDNSDFSYNLIVNTNLDENAIFANIAGQVSTTGIATANIDARYNGTAITLGLELTKDAIVVNYDGLNIYAKQSAIDALERILNNVIPNYVDINKLLKDNNINLENLTQTNISLPQLDLSQIILACDTLTLTKDTLTLGVDLSKFDQTINCYITLTVTDTGAGYIVSIDATYNNTPISLQISIAECSKFKTSIPENAINVEDYLNLVETISNTIDSYNYNLNVTATYQGYNVNADIIADLTQGIKLNLYTESLGSNLNITYSNNINKLLVTFGNLKISGSYDDLADILDFVKGDLNNVLISYGLDVINNLFDTTTLSNQKTTIDVTFEDIKDILYSIKFNGDTITFVKDNIYVALTTKDKVITNIMFTYDDIEVLIKVSDNYSQVNTDQTGFTQFADVLENVKALTKSISSQSIGGKVEIVYNGEVYTGNIKVNYINNVLAVNVSTQMYGQTISVTLIDSVIYLQVNDLMLQVSWAERYDLQDYLNTKFDLNIDIDNIVNNLTQALENQTSNEFDLKDINVDFIKHFVATNNGLDIEIDNIPVSITIGEYLDNTGKYISSVYTKVDGIEISLNEMVFGATAVVDNINDSDYKNYKTFAKYFDEVERLINASKDESLNQYTLRGNAKIYRLDSNGNTLKTNGENEEININIPNLKFDATKNTFVGGISATGSGNLYQDYLTGYDQALSVYYDYNFMYFDYNGMRIKFSKQSNAEFITNLKKAIPNYLSGSLGEQITNILDMVRFDTTGNMLFNPIDTSGISSDIGKYIAMLSTLKLNADNSLTIGVDISSMVPSFTQEILLNFMLDSNSKLSLTINKLKITDNLYIDFTIYVDTVSEFSAVPPATDANGNTIAYMDMTSIGKFLGDIDNTIQKTKDGEKYNINVSGSLNVKLTIIGININEPMPFTAQLTIDPTKDGSIIEAKIYIDVFENLLLNGTKDIKTTLYITDRLEGESIMYINRTGNALKSKYKVSELGNNIIRVISDITNISEDTLATIVSMELEYIDGPTKVENVLKEYLYNATGLKDRSYTIGLDMQQLSLLKMMVPYTSSNPTSVKLNVVNNMLNSVNIDNITLEPLSGINVYANANLDLSALTQPFDIVSEIEKLDPDSFGTWNDGSLIVSFEENGGTAVNNKMSKTGRNVSLPIPVKEVLSADENTLSVYKFIGWNDSANLNGNVYTTDYLMGSTSVTLYAMWELEYTYTKHTLVFDSMLDDYATTISDFNGYDITGRLPNVPSTVTKYYEEDGVSVTYSFGGWYTTRTQNEDGSYTYTNKFEQTVMPNSDMTVYANWVELDRVYQRKLTIYDAGTAKYTNYFTEGSDIDISSYISYKDTTRWFIDSTANDDTDNFTNEVAIDNMPTTMPENDLIIRIKNKYTLTFKSAQGDKTTKYVEAYQEEAISNLPTQSSFEKIVYTDGTKEASTQELHNNMTSLASQGKVPNYLETYVFGGYFLSTDAEVEAPTIMPNKNQTFDASWTYISTSFYKITFNVGWQKPSWWAPSSWLPMKEQTAPGAVAAEYVLSGSTLNNTTLTKKTSLVGLTTDITVSKHTTCKYKYGISYNFEIAGWNTNGAPANVYDDSYNNSTTINKAQDFYAVWRHC